jgi:hypothetical protein
MAMVYHSDSLEDLANFLDELGAKERKRAELPGKGKHEKEILIAAAFGYEDSARILRKTTIKQVTVTETVKDSGIKELK